jgi:hypothetical protein
MGTPACVRKADNTPTLCLLLLGDEDRILNNGVLSLDPNELAGVYIGFLSLDAEREVYGGGGSLL